MKSKEGVVDFKEFLKKKHILCESYLSRSPEDTKKVARQISKKFRNGDIIGFVGELGSGKTYFIKNIAKNFGIDENEVVSPTFVLMRIYKGKKNIHHFDLYRIKNYNELENIGYREYISFADLVVIEWADRIKEIYNDFNWIINIDYVSNKQRKIKVYKRNACI
ncbi:MAG TPA: tRNA (adenosine(37)-N6)-threonylcarbamoyltransferase complex ATPase subunit type 1 TsaE [Candidatus Goldiibacteriota bacterium]|nr:tRNA (adenosine(37)-N6)-threonylcarbamoyltransferase complex ATPase subunit type 1 TsaE [Candidatus Goldiibacteriota bacterium]